jgi:MFS family permease
LAFVGRGETRADSAATRAERRSRWLGLVALTIGVASVLTARAPTGTLLLAGRLLQGVGGALILPSALSIVNATFRGRDRAIAFGIWGFAGALAFLRESRDPDARRGADLPGVLLSTVGFAGLVFGLIEGQTYGWWTAKQPFLTVTLGSVSVIPLAFAVGVAALAAFVAVEQLRAPRGRAVLIDVALFRIPSFRNGSVAVMIDEQKS